VTQARLLADLATTATLAAFFASLLFIAAYSVVAPWWRTQIGRALVVMDAGIAMTLLPLALRFVFGLTTLNSTFFAWFQIGALALVAGSTVWRSVIVVQLQWKGRASRDGRGNDGLR
jgi:hypothetical protein